MASTNVRRVIVFNIILAIVNVYAKEQGVPTVKFEIFKPKGFRAYIDDVEDLVLFIFQGNVNKPIQSTDAGSVAGEVHKSVDNKWVVEDHDLELKVGDEINYYAFVSYKTHGYIRYYNHFLKENQSFTITELQKLRPLSASRAENSTCEFTITKIYDGRTACAGQIIYEDNFDVLKENYWKVEHSIPFDHNESPFVSYQRLPNNPTVTVENGNLRIVPLLLQDLPGYSNDSITCGSINLDKSCTSEGDGCYKKAVKSDILPPIVSGRITSRGFAFKYGTIHIRAKLPSGNWLYPEILLEPFHKNKYGRSKYASGVLKIAALRGNDDLNTTKLLYGNRVLYGGPVIDFSCSRLLLNHKLLPVGSRWGDEFHVYSMRWTPGGIMLAVDGKEWARLTPKSNGLVGWLPEKCTHAYRTQLGYTSGPKIAPFDDFFYITLGVAAGGITEFPDDSHTNGGLPKPWTNAGSKAMLKFWQDMPNWISTWDNPELLVDYVKVVAL